ncbi:uncharacterized protein PIG-X isoform X3 [Maniola hyperantus]|uniref:uncharacterized protein PIG-X isoform X3 n=1 Tax=Aphantopus hyperantus TaxID=2795564 RepID=UPI003748B925
MNKMMINNQVVLSKVSVIWCLLFLREIEGKNCNFNVQVEQKLLNEGFHRNLSINIDFASDNEEERWLYEDCMVGIEQTLPAGVYASPDEINDNGCKNLIHAIFKTPVNTELPAQKSEPLIIHLLSKVRDYRTHVYIPVHARYHHAAAGGGPKRDTSTEAVPDVSRQEAEQMRQPVPAGDQRQQLLCQRSLQRNMLVERNTYHCGHDAYNLGRSNRQHGPLPHSDERHCHSHHSGLALPSERYTPAQDTDAQK